MNFYENSASNESIIEKYQNKKNIEAIKAADEKKYVNEILLEREFGEPEILVEGEYSNLWCYPDKIIINKFDPGVFSTSNHVFKIVPMHSIKNLQFKNGKAFKGNIEIGIFGKLLSEESSSVRNGNMIIFKSDESISKAIDAYFYIAKRICGENYIAEKGDDNTHDNIQSTEFNNKDAGKQKVCSGCGRVMGAGSVFCGNCGKKYEE